MSTVDRRVLAGCCALLLTLACRNEGSSDGLFGEGQSGDDGASGGSGADDGGDDSSGGSGGGDDGGGDGGDDGDDDGDGGIKFDTAHTGTGGGDPEDCGCGNDQWSYIWISNAMQSTVSKVNTRTLEEEGRYITRPDSDGNPSRTSVSLGGRSVAVANRNGGVIKIWARPQFCDEDKNGVPGLQTSTGAGDILPWGEDDCVAWYTPFDSYTTQRPVAWAGDVNPLTCDDETLWTVGCDGGMGGVNVHILHGETGAVEETIYVAEFMCGTFGAYGGAVDTQGNFWFSHNGSGGKLAFVDRQTLEYKVYSYPANFAGYGIAVDNKSRPWVSSYGGNLGVGRFDPDTEQWETLSGFASQGGVQQAEDGRLWVATVAGFGGTLNQDGIISVDPETVAAGTSTPVSGGTVKGISLDMDGYVWAVTGVAHKYDPDTLVEQGSYGGLTGPYTYSDMTGWGLQNAACNPAG